MLDDKKYWIALNLVPGIGNKIYSTILEKFESPEKVFESSKEKFLQLKKVTLQILSEINNILD